MSRAANQVTPKPSQPGAIGARRDCHLRRLALEQNNEDERKAQGAHYGVHLAYQDKHQRVKLPLRLTGGA
jgi:hypothetical protein